MAVFPLGPNTIPMGQFPLKWRFTDPAHTMLPEGHLQQIQPLAPVDARRLWEVTINLQRDFPFTSGMFPLVVSTRLDGWSEPTEERRVRKWLYQRGIPFGQHVYLSYQPEWGITTTWKLLVKYWSSFYYPISDDLTVVDPSLRWAALFFHEHEVFFGTTQVAKDTATKNVRNESVRDGHLQDGKAGSGLAVAPGW